MCWRSRESRLQIKKGLSLRTDGNAQQGQGWGGAGSKMKHGKEHFWWSAERRIWIQTETRVTKTESSPEG
jgi:hypothetical protein